MKTVYVFGTRGFPGVQGGVEKHCEQLYPELTAEYDIYVFRRIPFLPVGSGKIYGKIHFIDLPSTRIKGFEAFFHSLLCTFYCIIKRPDIVHIHNIGPGMFVPLLKLFGLKVVLTYHSANYEHKKWGYVARKILKLSEWIALKWADAIIFVNKMQMGRFKDKIKVKSRYIPNGVAVKSQSMNTDFIERLGLAPQGYILAVGRITQEKGFDYLINGYAASSHDKCKLVLAGGIDHKSAYSSKIKDLAAKHGVVMVGYVDGEPLRQLYSHARLFVLPSYNEGFPLVLLEAMSYHLPILASDIPANKLPELPEGCFFKVGDVPDLAAHIKRELSSSQCRVDYAIDGYTWENVGLQVAKVFGGL